MKLPKILFAVALAGAFLTRQAEAEIHFPTIRDVGVLPTPLIDGTVADQPSVMPALQPGVEPRFIDPTESDAVMPVIAGKQRQVW